jgi:hypothetical protein
MAFETKNNQGAIFPNDRKEKESQPDRTGNLVVMCPHCKEATEYWVSGWVREMKKKAANYISLAISPKEDWPATANTDEEPVRVARTRVPNDFDDDTPF